MITILRFVSSWSASSLIGGAMLALTVPITMADGGTLLIENKAPFAKGIDVRPAIRLECRLEENVPKFTSDYAKDHFDKVELVSGAKQGKVLRMQIVAAAGTAGGAWSGRKSLVVEGTLTENGKQIGSFVAERTSGKNYRGTCPLLGRSAKAIGKDVAEWLQTPTINARLGEAK